MKPATDLCHTCQLNSRLLMRSANMPESIKSQRLTDAQAHVTLAQVQCSYYNSQCASAKKSLEEIAGNIPSQMHYSFDFAQQVHYPFHPQQPGPIFFKTPRKCVGVTCEVKSTQVNYLIDEADDIGKGANTVISMIRYYLQIHGLKEKNLKLHADNCVGQNKNMP